MLPYRIGQSYDLHNLNEGNGFWLGGIFIACNFNVEADSDGDVILHTVSEAIIGALCLGDLGEYFNHANAPKSSVAILQKALLLMNDANYEINNIDCLVIADKPHLANFKPLIKHRMAELLKIKLDQINVKATTTENNQPHTISAHCTVLLKKS